MEHGQRSSIDQNQEVVGQLGNPIESNSVPNVCCEKLASLVEELLLQQQRGMQVRELLVQMAEGFQLWATHCTNPNGGAQRFGGK